MVLSGPQLTIKMGASSDILGEPASEEGQTTLARLSPSMNASEFERTKTRWRELRQRRSTFLRADDMPGACRYQVQIAISIAISRLVRSVPFLALRTL